MRQRSSRNLRRIGVVAVLFLLAGCSSGTSDPGSEPAAGEADAISGQTGSESDDADTQPSGEPIRLGILLPQTGDAGEVGRYMTSGYVAAIEELNSAGGISGHPIEYEVFDTVGDPQNSVSAYNRFRAAGFNIGLIGYSAPITAVGPIAAEDDEVLLINSGTPPFDPQALGTHTIHTRNGQDDEMRCAATYAYEEMGARRAGFIYSDIAANQAGVEKFAEIFEDLGGETVGFEATPEGTTDFRAPLSRLQQGDPDLIYLYNIPPDPGNTLRSMAELGMSDLLKMGYSGLPTPQVIEVAGEAAAEGTVTLAGYYDDQVEQPVTEQFLTSWREYVDDSVEATDLTYYHATTYDGVKVLAEAMTALAESGGDIFDARQVQEAFYMAGPYEAVTGTAAYEEGNLVPQKPFQILQVQDGAWTATATIEDC